MQCTRAPETSPVTAEMAAHDAKTVYKAGEGRLGTNETAFGASRNK